MAQFLGPQATAAEVENHWALPADFSAELSGQSVHKAFKIFFDWLQRALDSEYERAINTALLEDAAKAGKVPRIHGWQPWPSKEYRDEVDREVGRRLRERSARLLPVIRTFTLAQPNVPIVLARTLWLVDQIESIEGAIEGLHWLPHHKRDVLVLYPKTIEPNLWREFRDALLDLADSLTAEKVDTAQQLVPVDHVRLRWLGGADLFGYLFRHLADHGYIEAPMKRKKGEMEVHAEEFAELVERLWEIDNGKGGTAAKSTLTTALRRGASINADTIKKFLDDMAKEEKK